MINRLGQQSEEVDGLGRWICWCNWVSHRLCQLRNDRLVLVNFKIDIFIGVRLDRLSLGKINNFVGLAGCQSCHLSTVFYYLIDMCRDTLVPLYSILE